jgi:hypothetical protein
MTQTYIKIGANLYTPEAYDVPIDRTFRNAWQASEELGAITVDMSAAKDIWRNKIRAAREPEFAKLDADFMKALETGASTATIVSQKQALRDAPADPAIESAQTPEELKAVQPANLTVE